MQALRNLATSIVKKNPAKFQTAGFALISAESEIEAGVSQDIAVSKWLNWLKNDSRNTL